MHPLATDELIKAFLMGKCSEEELKELQLWLSLPQNKDKVETLFKEKWQEVSADTPLINLDSKSIFKGIETKLHKQEHPRKTTGFSRNRQAFVNPQRKRSWMGIKVFTCLALTLIISYFFIPTDQLATDYSVEQYTKTAPRGYRNSVTLIDGSMAILNSESTITYDENFGKENRTIYLTGEAFFKVAHNPEKPFIVVAKDLKTTALGTSFNVNAYAENNTAISLATGKVRVELNDAHTNTTDTTQMILTPGEQAVWTGAAEGLIKREFDIRKTLSWKNNVIYFNNTSLESMIRVLEKWYDVKITINGNINKLTHTGTGKFKNKSLENVLSSLGYTMGFTYQINKKTITLKLTDK